MLQMLWCLPNGMAEAALQPSKRRLVDSRLVVYPPDVLLLGAGVGKANRRIGHPLAYGATLETALHLASC